MTALFRNVAVVSVLLGLGCNQDLTVDVQQVGDATDDGAAAGDVAVGDPNAGDPYVLGDPYLGDPYVLGDPYLGDPYVLGDSYLGDPYVLGDPYLGDPYVLGDPHLGDPYLGDPNPGDPPHGDPNSGDPLHGDPVGGDPLGGDAILELVTITIEAESGTLTEPFASVDDVTANGGAYLVDGAGPGMQSEGAAVYSFTLTTTAVQSFYIWGRVLAVDTGTDSFYVSMDRGPEHNYFTALCNWSTDWQWTFVDTEASQSCPYTPVPLAFPLGPGDHVLRFSSREGQSAIDTIVITSDPTLVPSD